MTGGTGTCMYRYSRDWQSILNSGNDGMTDPAESTSKTTQKSSTIRTAILHSTSDFRKSTRKPKKTKKRCSVNKDTTRARRAQRAPQHARAARTPCASHPHRIRSSLSSFAHTANILERWRQAAIALTRLRHAIFMLVVVPGVLSVGFRPFAMRVCCSLSASSGCPVASNSVHHIAHALRAACVLVTCDARARRAS